MSIFNNNKGFFQGDGQGGTKFSLGGGLQNLGNMFKDKPYEGIPGVCPFTGQPLRSKTELQNGVSDSISMNPNTQRQRQMAPTTGKYGAINSQLMGGFQ